MNHIFAVTKQIFKTVKIMHDRGIYHLDLKPENILYDGFQNIKILDLGTAQQVLDRRNPVCFVAERTELFSLRSDLRFGEVNGEKYDVYSLGCTLYNLATGSYLQRPLKCGSNEYLGLAYDYCILLADLIYHMTAENV